MESFKPLGAEPAATATSRTLAPSPTGWPETLISNFRGSTHYKIAKPHFDAKVILINTMVWGNPTCWPMSATAGSLSRTCMPTVMEKGFFSNAGVYAGLTSVLTKG